MKKDDIEIITQRRSLRLKNYNYAQLGMYYVTICVHHKLYLFGDIVDSHMKCNDAGMMIWYWFHSIEKKYSDIRCDECIVMPNHVHLIITNVGTREDSCLRIIPDNHKGTSLSHVMGWWKTMTTNAYIQGVNKYRWQRFNNRLWQRNYWEHIIRNETSLNEIREYIRYNPQKWATDSMNIDSNA